MVSRDLHVHAESRIGSVLNGKWRLVRLLGVGGMAAVYGAEHRNRKRAAVKVLHPQYSYDENVKTRFLREGYVANTIDHPGAVTVDDDDVAEDGSAFLVMELLQGEPLDLRAERLGGVLPTHEVVVLTLQLLDVLHVAHRRDVIHRDLKPDNLFLTVDGHLKVLDFGIARIMELSAPGTSTSIGTMMGTPAFMAPEQARGRWNEVDATSDLWAVGATMFTLLTNQHVHAAENANEQMVKAATEHAPSIGSILPDLAEPLVHVIDHALAFDKTERWPTARDMREALERVHAVLPEGPPPKAPQSSIVAFEDVDREAHTVLAPSSPSGSAPDTGTNPTMPSAPAPAPSSPRIEALGREPTVNAAAVSTSAPSPARPPERRRWVLLGIAAAVVVGAFVVVMSVGSDETASTSEEDRPAPGADLESTNGESAPTQEPAHPAATAGEPTVKVEPVTAEDEMVSSDAGANSDEPPAAERTPSSPTRVAPQPRPAPTRTTAAKPAPKPAPAAKADPKPKPAPSPKPANDDPFSRRF